jgi:acyl transferase domain-containing protein/NADPH:quinone reductase-like Zn-dependent oxidoreductase/acyl carrier protein
MNKKLMPMNPQNILESLKAKKITPQEAFEALEKIGYFNSKENYGLVLTTTHLVNEISIKDWSLSKPSADEVTIQVKASAINFPDIMCVKGLYPTMPDYPFVPGFEVSGIVVKTGILVKDIKEGDEVIALAGEKMGGHASHINVPATNVIKKPSNISFEEACSLPVVFGTVYYAFQKANLAENEHVLIQTATGGCGLAALQLARLKNCVCYGTSSKNEKLDILKKLNIDYAINYKSIAFDKEIKQLTKGRGVDVVLNMLSGDDIQRGLNCLAPGGRYIEIAVHALKTSPKLDLSMLVQNQSIYSIDLRQLSLEKGFHGKEILTLLAKLLEAEEIVPIVSRIYPLNQIKDAFEYVEKGNHIGKVVISHTHSSMIDCTNQCINLLRKQQDHCKATHPSQKNAISTSLTILEKNKSETKKEAIAVIGMSGQFPKAKNVGEFWDNILKAKDCISEIPITRWAINPNRMDKDFCKWMGVLEDVDKFDPLFFNISPIEAELMDPQQRLFLENSWHCFEDAGYSPASLSGSRCGVFVGCGTGDYGQLKTNDHLNAQGLMGASVSILSARISYLMNLKGPCLAIDTACSSSLVAIATACDSLILGNCDLALAGGVYVMSGPSMHITTSNAGMLSKDGRCYTFDNHANGFVPSEGVGVILLKRLSDAIQDEDNIYGVIRGWGINQDGKTNGITAPSVNSQIDLETEVYRRFNIDPQTITLVEAHGTGTKLGDPIEVEALTSSFRSFTDKKNYCALGSVKSNVGHLMTAAGVTGAIKTLMALKQNILPPSIHFEKLNEHIVLENSPFYVNTTLQTWKSVPGVPRRAAVSAFGFSGTNAHLVLEEYTCPPKIVMHNSRHPFIFVLSAQNKDRLKDYAISLRQYVIANNELNLANIAYTLQIGRDAMDYRLALITNSKEELSDKLKVFINEEAESGIFHSFIAKTKNDTGYSKEEIISLWQKGDYEVIADLWIKGVAIDWSLLYDAKKPRRISLPTYPFAKERYWLPEKINVNTQDGVNTLISRNNYIHPLIHQNASDFSGQKFISTFDGNEFFLADHIIQGFRILPAAAYLEMVRVAIIHSINTNNKHIQLRNIIWIRPLKVDKQPIQVQVNLIQTQEQQISFEIYSKNLAIESELILHCQGYAALNNFNPSSLDLISLQQQCNMKIYNAEQCYDLFHQLGIDYGPSFRALDTLYIGLDQALGKLSLPAISDNPQYYVLHPGLIDAALQSTIGLLINRNIDNNHSFNAAIPYVLEELQLLSKCTPNMWTLVKLSEKSQSLDIDICNEKGDICVRIKGYISKIYNDKVEKAAENDGTLLLKPSWQQQALLTNNTKIDYHRHFLILVESENIFKADIEKVLPNVYCLELKKADVDSTQPIEQRFISYATTIFGLIKKIIKEKSNEKVLFQIVVPAHSYQVLYSGLYALLQTAQIENPQLIGQLIAIASSKTDTSLSIILENTKTSISTYAYYDNGKRWILDWKEVNTKKEASIIPWKDRGVYLISGGLGGLGSIFAADIVKHCPQAAAILTGRSTLDTAKQMHLKKLTANGEKISYVQIDVKDQKAVLSLIQDVIKDHGHLNGIIHSAGVIKDNFILNKSLDEFQSVLIPKIIGLVNLDLASKDISLDFFIAFSSIAACKGNIGQIDYATANAFMDSYMHYRNQLVLSHQRHGKSLSINWPLWQAGGMQVEQGIINQMEEVRGMKPLQTEGGLKAFYHSLSNESCQMMILEGNIEKLKLFMNPVVQLKEEISQQVMAEPIELKKQIIDFVRNTLSKIIKIPIEKIQLDTPFEKYGIDSIIQLKLINEFEKTVGELSKTLLFEHSTTEELVNYFLTNHISKFSKVDLIDKSIIVTTTHHETYANQPLSPSLNSDDVAIIGISGRYPLSETLEELWENLKSGKSCITSAPKDRWLRQSFLKDIDKKYQIAAGPEYYGGFLKSIDHFDYHLFDIKKENVLDLSPEVRLFLEIVWETFEDAGYSRKSLQTMQENKELGIGVFVGTMYNQYAWSFPSPEQAILGSNGGDWQIANRISHYFNLIGPSITINTACSSSLTAIHLACESLRNKNSLMAIAGGVNLTLHPSKYDALTQAGFLDTGNLSKSFGNGKGYIPGEGVGAVLLKPLANAIKEDDRIYGVIKSSFINHGGGRQMYSVPEPKQQSQLINQAIKRSGINPETISYIESAANGSPLGDPIEVVALKNAFKPYTDKLNFCGLGSVKSNLGHLEAASGISQLTKVLLQLKFKTLVPSINANPLNPNIKLNDTPFYIQDKILTWKTTEDINNTKSYLPRRCMINSFGAGGSYANIIVEEFIKSEPMASEEITITKPQLFVFSAKTKTSIMAYMKRMYHFIQNTANLDIRKLASSLQKINNGLEHRVAILASTTHELLDKIRFLQDQWVTLIEKDIYYCASCTNDNRVDTTKIQYAFDNDDIRQIIEFWLAGNDIDFRQYYNNQFPIINIPKYAFDHEVIFRFSEQNLLKQPKYNNDKEEFDDHFYPLLLKKVLAGQLSKDNAWQLINEL